MNYIVIGNVIALIGSLLMIYSGLIKKKEKVIYVQTLQIIMFALSNIVLGGITGAIINIISCLRNILCYKNKLTKEAKILIILLVTILCLIFNNKGFISFLPLISTIVYTLLMNIKNIIKFKILIIFTMILWCIYDWYIKSYSSALFDFLCIITNSISIWQIALKNKQKNRRIL